MIFTDAIVERIRRAIYGSFLVFIKELRRYEYAFIKGDGINTSQNDVE